MHNIHYNCKICKRPGIAKAALDCDPEWIDKLAPALTCNRCFDLRERKNKATETIFRACSLIIQAEGSRDVSERIKPKAREALIASTRELARVYMDYYGMDSLAWDMDFVNQLVDDPRSAGKRVNFYSREMARMAKGGAIPA